jgi:hypothetical protein
MLLSAATALVCQSAMSAAAFGASPEVKREYDHRFTQIDSNDVAKHYDLAIWLKQQEAYDLLRIQAQQVLKLDPNHVQAKLLLDLANVKLAASSNSVDSNASASGSTTQGVRPPGSGPRMVTEAEIQKMRRDALLSAPVDVAGLSRIRFKGRVIEEFLKETANPNYMGREGERVFRRLADIEKLRTIVQESGDKFVNDIDITDNPSFFEQFRDNANLHVIKNCATSGCHGSGTAPMQLITRRSRGDEALYTNFIILHNYKVGSDPVINYQDPRSSLLLRFGQVHPGGIRSPFERNPQAEQEITQWLRSLPLTRPDYDIDLTPPPKSN